MFTNRNNNSDHSFFMRLALQQAQKTLGSMAPTYFVAVAGIVAAFFGAQAYSKKTNGK